MKTFGKFIEEQVPAQQQPAPQGSQVPLGQQQPPQQGQQPQQQQAQQLTQQQQPGGLGEMEQLFAQLNPRFSKHPNAAVQQAYKTFEQAVTNALQTPGDGAAQQMVNKNPAQTPTQTGPANTKPTWLSQ